MQAETWISVDVETSGPTPATGSLLAIGACLVDRPEEGIELLLRPDPGLPWRRGRGGGPPPGPRSPRPRGPGARPRRWSCSRRGSTTWCRPAAARSSSPSTPRSTGCSWPTHVWRHLGRNPFGISALDLKALYLGRHLDEVERWAETTSDHVRRRYPVDLPHTHGALDDAREQAEICRRIRDGARRPSGQRIPPLGIDIPLDKG